MSKANSPSGNMKLTKLLNKNVLLVATAAVLIAIILFVGISSCSRASYYQLALDNLSEARFYMKQDEDSNLKVQFFTGMRENPYNQDGISEKTTAFGIINVEPKDKSLSGLLSVEGVLKAGDESIPVTLDKNPYGNNFACDVERLFDKGTDLSFTLNTQTNGVTNSIVFNLQPCMADGAISWEKALEIACGNLTSKIKKAGKFECYVKIISDLVANTGSYWYVQFITQKGDTFFCVVDADGNIVNK